MICNLFEEETRQRWKDGLFVWFDVDLIPRHFRLYIYRKGNASWLFKYDFYYRKLNILYIRLDLSRIEYVKATWLVVTFTVV